MWSQGQSSSHSWLNCAAHTLQQPHASATQLTNGGQAGGVGGQEHTAGQLLSACWCTGPKVVSEPGELCQQSAGHTHASLEIVGMNSYNSETRERVNSVPKHMLNSVKIIERKYNKKQPYRLSLNQV